jgi:hypothetical protein
MVNDNKFCGALQDLHVQAWLCNAGPDTGQCTAEARHGEHDWRDRQGVFLESTGVVAVLCLAVQDNS